ncbi:DUF397 domain-containing protein [Streptomyces sp. BH-SS-21]|uniref:DUF397 domain-containing protein n=1 Tax=Streptomyces liliiviolaceus TaxID=2823109 RepID=A0A940Y7V6_9ACTN|nr:DUF397 domain-containing protein [Streptomyces liliiviolaceus]MBQ0854826.1 DUF397 domain-containing protein [Streptomyces liliiviolaceus]
MRSWRKSSFSENTNCVEVSPCEDGVVVRDSKCCDVFLLTVSLPCWWYFLTAIQDDRGIL